MRMDETKGGDSNRPFGGLRCSAVMTQATPLRIDVNDADARKAIQGWGLR